MSGAAYRRLRRTVAKAAGRKLPAAPRGPNANERTFGRTVLAGRGAFEPRSFAVTESGRVYTPDFRYDWSGGGGAAAAVMVEVKGAYRSAKDAKLICERSRLAWEVAGDRHPGFLWAWAKRVRGGYECELRGMDGRRTRALCRDNADFERLLVSGAGCAGATKEKRNGNETEAGSEGR